jgi:hypothetical protein
LEQSPNSWPRRIPIATPDTELLGIEKVGRIDFVVISEDLGRKVTFMRTGFRPIGDPFTSIFRLSPGSGLTYHNVLYDTPIATGVKTQVAESKGFVKTRLSTGSCWLCGLLDQLQAVDTTLRD